MPKNDKITEYKLLTLIVGEMMTIRGEISLLSSSIAMIDGIEKDKKELFAEISYRNTEKFKKLEELFREMITDDTQSNAD